MSEIKTKMTDPTASVKKKHQAVRNMVNVLLKMNVSPDDIMNSQLTLFLRRLDGYEDATAIPAGAQYRKMIEKLFE